MRTASEHIHLNLGSSGTRTKIKECQMNYTFQSPFKKTQCGMMRKLEVTFGRSQENFIFRHHVVKLYVPREESFLLPLKHIDVTRTTNASLGRFVGEDYWNVDGEKETVRCTDRLHKIHIIE